MKMYRFVVLSVILSTAFASTCKTPVVHSESFTTQDATIVTNIAFISEFEVQCTSGELTTLYSLINGNVAPVPVIGKNRYQIGWTEDVKTASSGDKIIGIYDEEGYVNLRKAQRSGEDAQTVEPLFQVTVNYPGAYNGPWLKGELLATIILLVVAHFAVSYKLKIGS